PLKLGNVLEQPLTEIWNEISEWFDLPRCGCLMKKLCMETDAFQNETELPLSTEKSKQLCTQLQRDENLPQVFKNLFKDRKPTNPPANQR
ncbi:MAG: hypothetical protein ACYSOH_04565, partial [Planctomycetota bacterium]